MSEKMRLKLRLAIERAMECDCADAKCIGPALKPYLTNLLEAVNVAAQYERSQSTKITSRAADAVDRSRSNPATALPPRLPDGR